MYCPSRLRLLLAASLLLQAWPLLALETDRQQPLDVKADSTGGTLGDGVTTLSGHVEVRQGTLLIRADQADVDKIDGKVTQITLRGETAYLQQEIEEQGLVKARARLIEYQVANGLVVFTGSAEVQHPQYEVSGDQLRYDLAAQHFEGVGSDEGNGRIRIRLDPEVIEKEGGPESGKPAQEPSESGSGDGDPVRNAAR